MSESAAIPAGVLQRHQPQIACYLLAALKAVGFSEDQHEGQGSERTNPGMRHQSPGFGTLLHFLLDRLAQFRDGRVQSIQQLQQIASPPAGPRSQPERLQLLSSACPPQPLLTAQAFIERHRLQLVHDPGARLHHAVPVPQQLPQIPVLPPRYPDLGKTILQQQLQDQSRVLAVRLLPAHSLRTDLSRIADPQLNLQLRQQSFKPARMSAGLHAHTYCLPADRNSAIELLRLLAMR